MKRPERTSRPTLLAAGLVGLACATCTTGQVPVPVIEPVKSGSSTSASMTSGSMTSASMTNGSTAGELPSAEGLGEETRAVTRYVVRLGSAWFSARAEWLGISARQAERRDAELSGTLPPEGFWDKQTSTEAAALWGALCNDCHGGRRRVSRAKEIPPPDVDWGTKQGFFFGRPRLPSQVFETILSGGPPRGALPSEMPAWERRLSREQIWALVYFIAFESGGVEGAFPPSLFPRTTD